MLHPVKIQSQTSQKKVLGPVFSVQSTANLDQKVRVHTSWRWVQLEGRCFQIPPPCRTDVLEAKGQSLAPIKIWVMIHTYKFRAGRQKEDFRILQASQPSQPIWVHKNIKKHYRMTSIDFWPPCSQCIGQKQPPRVRI